MSASALEVKSPNKAVPDDFEMGPEVLKQEVKETENVPAGHVAQTPEEKALNRALNRKLDIYLLPFLSLL